MRRKSKSTLTHVDSKGAARMVDVGGKPIMQREAVAEGFLVAAPATIDRLMKRGGADLPKGEALSTARIAGIAAAKKCDELIPLCHTLPLDAVSIDFERRGGAGGAGGAGRDRVRIVATARISAKTGVEMEALVAVSIAALTLYDMTKAIDKSLRIEGVRLVSKTKR
jgi:cyclic pyranopterin phosphate synthase